MSKRVAAGQTLFVGPARRVYYATRVNDEHDNDGTAIFSVVIEKRDVTEMFEECARVLGWTPPAE